MHHNVGTILLVEDDDEVRQLLARSLQGTDLDVEQAANGAEGLQAARRLAGVLKLIVTDINMPVMSGLEFVRELRQAQPQVPILLITGVDTQAASVEAGRLRAELLVKPFGPDLFRNTVTRILVQATAAARSFA